MAKPDEPSTDLVQSAKEEMTEEVGRFVGTIFGAASIEFSEMLGDRVGWWRLKQSIRLAKKAKELLDAEGLTPEQVPLRTAVPLLESGSLEQDENLVDRWAALLANAAGGTVAVPPSFGNVLRELEPPAALLLEHIYEEHMTLAPDLREHYGIRLRGHQEALGLDDEAVRYHLDNLTRLGLLRSGSLTVPDYHEQMAMTAFGRAFVKACRPPGTPEPPIQWTDREKLNAHIQARKEREAEEVARRAVSGLKPPDGQDAPSDAGSA
jgi:hypothetical protein